MKITTSEIIAMIFFIVGALFLIPIIIFGVMFLLPVFLYGSMFALPSLFIKEHFIFGISYFACWFLTFGFFGFGVHLMIGYYRHFFGKLDKKKIDKLWIKTICFNGILSFPSFYFHMKCWLVGQCLGESLLSIGNELSIFNEKAFTMTLLIWWATAIIFSFIALLSVKNSEN